MESKRGGAAGTTAGRPGRTGARGPGARTADGAGRTERRGEGKSTKSPKRWASSLTASHFAPKKAACMSLTYDAKYGSTVLVDTDGFTGRPCRVSTSRNVTLVFAVASASAKGTFVIEGAAMDPGRYAFAALNTEMRPPTAIFLKTVDMGPRGERGAAAPGASWGRGW